jgi:hypothetical protein
MIFSDPDPTFQLVPDLDPVLDSTCIFSNTCILNINSTFVFPFVRLHIMTRYKLLGELGA